MFIAFNPSLAYQAIAVDSSVYFTLFGAVALLLAVMANRVVRGALFYKTLLIWPYAIAPALSAVLWIILLHPNIGLVGARLNRMGIKWDYHLDGAQAMLTVVLASAWKQVSYNFIFFLAGLQSIPRAVLEAARMDGARGWRRFRTIVFPLLAPTTFFLLVVNMVYAAFDTFACCSARHTFSCIAGISMRGAPTWASASLTAFITAGSAPQVPDSPAPFTPSGFFFVGTTMSCMSMAGKSSARGMV